MQKLLLFLLWPTAYPSLIGNANSRVEILNLCGNIFILKIVSQVVLCNVRSELPCKHDL